MFPVGRYGPGTTVTFDMGKIFIFAAETITNEINVAWDMLYIDYLVRQDTVTPMSMCRIEIITQYHIPQC